jgi:hypothetical protein
MSRLQNVVRAHILKRLAMLVSLAALGFFAWSFHRHMADMPEIRWTPQSGLIWFVSVLLGSAGVVVNGTGWHRLVLDQGKHLPWHKAIALCAVTQFAKYLPGNVGQHIGRVWLAQREGIPVAITLTITFTETLWLTGVAVALSAVALTLFADARTLGLGFELSTRELAGMVVALVLTPWAGAWGLNRFLPGMVQRLMGGGGISLPRVPTALAVSLLYLLCFLLLGATLKLQAVWLFDVQAGSVIELTCLFAAAWLAGYLVPGAPAGLGIRESMMLVLMGPLLGAGTVMGLAVTLRVTTSLGDVLAYGLGMWIRRV